MVAFSELVVFRAASSLQGFSADIRVMTLLGAVKSPSHNILTTVCDLPKLQRCSSEWPLCWTLQQTPLSPTPVKNPNCCYPEFSATEAASRKHTSQTLYWLGWGVRGWGETLSPGFCSSSSGGGGAMFLINGLHKLFRKSCTIRSMKWSRRLLIQIRGHESEPPIWLEGEVS